MIRFLHKSASLVGLCVLAFAIGCGSSSKKKTTCDGGPCADAGRSDVSGDVKKDSGSADVVTKLDVVSTDTKAPDTTPVSPDTALADVVSPTDTTPVNTDTPVLPPDAGVDTAVIIPDTRPVDTNTTDTNPTVDTRLDTTVVTDTNTTDAPAVDAPVVDAAAVDAPAVDAAGDASADAEGDAETDA